MSTDQLATADAKPNRHQRRTSRSQRMTARRAERHDRVRARVQARAPEMSLVDQTIEDLKAVLPPLPSAKLAAKTIGVTERTLWSWRDRGLLTAMKIAGGRVVIPRAEILRLVREALESAT